MGNGRQEWEGNAVCLLSEIYSPCDAGGLKSHHPKVLTHFSVNEKGRKYRFWQRDPLAVKMESRTMVEQKLDYLHNNPLQPQWNLAKSPEDYHYSSAIFYETGSCSFDFLTHYMERFG